MRLIYSPPPITYCSVSRRNLPVYISDLLRFLIRLIAKQVEAEHDELSGVGITRLQISPRGSAACRGNCTLLAMCTSLSLRKVSSSSSLPGYHVPKHSEVYTVVSPRGLLVIRKSGAASCAAAVRFVSLVAIKAVHAQSFLRLLDLISYICLHAISEGRVWIRRPSARPYLSQPFSVRVSWIITSLT